MRLAVVALVGLLTTSCACVTEQDRRADADKIKAACVIFFNACRDEDFDTAKRSLAKMTDEVPDDYVLGRLRRYGRLSTLDEEKMGPVKVVKRKAVLAYREKPTDLDPLYFAYEGGAWRILLPLTKYRHPCFAWSPEDLASFTGLERWFEEFKKTELYGERRPR